VAAEFGRIQENGGLSKRRAVAALAKRRGLSANEVYAAIEAHKKSGKLQNSAKLVLTP
jgi:hypothetical protein